MINICIFRDYNAFFNFCFRYFIFYSLKVINKKEEEKNSTIRVCLYVTRENRWSIFRLFDYCKGMCIERGRLCFRNFFLKLIEIFIV